MREGVRRRLIEGKKGREREGTREGKRDKGSEEERRGGRARKGRWARERAEADEWGGRVICGEREGTWK